MKTKNDILIRFSARNQIHNRQQLIDQLKEKLTGRVKEAWLFGSAAREDFNRKSDIDLILVIQTHRLFHERINDFTDLLYMGHEMDILIYTPEEFANQKKRADENSFWKSVLGQMIRII